MTDTSSVYDDPCDCTGIRHDIPEEEDKGIEPMNPTTESRSGSYVECIGCKKTFHRSEYAHWVALILKRQPTCSLDCNIKVGYVKES